MEDQYGGSYTQVGEGEEEMSNDQKKVDLILVYQSLLRKAKQKKLIDWARRIEKRLKELMK